MRKPCLLQALGDDPFDDLSKSAYADWLEERENFSSDPPRLRLQAEWLGLLRAGPNADPARYLELRTQLRQHQETLPMGGGVGGLTPLVGDVLHWSSHYNCTRNTFLVIVRETPRTVLAAGLPTKLIMNANGCGQTGTERPVLPGLEALQALCAAKSGFRQRKDPPGPDGSRSFTRRHQRFRVWDGRDKWFDTD